MKRHGTQGRKLVSNVYKYHIIATGMLFVAAVQKQSKTNLFFFRFACSKVFGVPQPTKRLPESFFVSFLINSIHVCHYFITIHSRFSQFRYSFRLGNCHTDTSSKFYSTCKNVCFIIFWVLFCLLCALPGDLTVKIRDLALCISCQ